MRKGKQELRCSNSRDFYHEIEVKNTNLGKSLFAKNFIKQGSIIWEDGHHELVSVTKEEILSWPESKQKVFCDYSWQEDENLFSGTYTKEEVDLDASNFINHSCDPSCWFITDKHIAARRDIYPGDEITIDYATSDTVFITIPQCECGKAKCRKIILPTDYKRPELQQTYNNHFRMYLLRRIFKERIALGDRGAGILFQLHKNVELRESAIHGRGLYARLPMRAGTLVWEANEPVDDIWVDLSETDVHDLQGNDFSRVVRTYFEMNEHGKFREPKFAESIERDASNFFNHACEPNLWFEGDDRLIAMHDIEIGEELTYDYATAKRLFASRFDCHCNAKSCRKEITYEDYKLPQIREKYGEHMVSHWLKLLLTDPALV